MGKYIEKIYHNECGKKTLGVFENDGSYDGYCFACGVKVSDPYKDKPDGYKPKIKKKSKEEIAAAISEIAEYKTTDLPTRGLKKEYLNYFGVKMAVSEVDGETPTVAYLPYFSDEDGSSPVAYKARLLHNKSIWAIGDLKEGTLFGWHKAIASGAKKLIVTEGEYDAIALFQAVKEINKNDPRMSKFNPAIVSVRNGAGSAANELSKMKAEIRKRFTEIILAFDMDKPGRDAVDEVVKIFPKAKVATLPCKDANECLLEGKSKALMKAVMFQAVEKKNTRLVWAKELHEKAKQEAPWGVSWPWNKVTEWTRGIRKGETIYIGAGQKMGKSEVVNTLAAHLIKEHGWKVMLAKPEESNNKTYKMVAGKVVGRIFHDPKVEFDYEAYDKAGAIIGDKLCMLNLYQHLGWETLKEDIEVAAAEGCDAIFIDPITNLTNGMSPSDANTKLQEIAQSLAAMALDLNVVIFIFCHLRNPDSGPPHERGGEVLPSQFAGSRAMARSCNYMFGIEGNKDPSLPPEERNIRELVLLEDREYGEVGRVKLYWDKNTGLFKELQ